MNAFVDMKILVFTGGLGNQIFGYAFYCWIKDKFPQQNFYGIYNHSNLIDRSLTFMWSLIDKRR